MKNYSLTLAKNQMDLLLEMYGPYQVETNIPHAIFQAKKADVSLIFYQNGTLLIKGEFQEELRLIKNRLGLINFSAIGSDEVGTGDLFGPIVVCSAFVSADDIEKLEAMGVRDSKNITDRQIIELAPKLSKMLIHSVLILKPNKYNVMVRRGFNMNKIKAFLHNQAILLTVKKVEKEVPVIVDQFCLPKIYYNYLKDESKVYRDISFYTNAENIHISVAAASIIARYAFLAKMQQFSRFAGIRLLKGAGKDVDKQLVYLYKRKGYDTLRPITKLNFRNLKKNQITPQN
ncbi:MAG: ribonuclease HIII [Acholeplasmataceae bacterium]|jgi:ribonuclease HIII|nr:ribonuclease HIII [Acholeplasmataceae bacterium]